MWEATPWLSNESHDHVYGIWQNNAFGTTEKLGRYIPETKSNPNIFTNPIAISLVRATLLRPMPEYSYVDTRATDNLAHCVSRSLAAMGLTISYTRIIVYPKEEFRYSAEWGDMSESTNVFHISQKQFNTPRAVFCNIVKTAHVHHHVCWHQWQKIKWIIIAYILVVCRKLLYTAMIKCVAFCWFWI